MAEPTPASVAIALSGSGGGGVITAGTMLLGTAARAGLYGMLNRTVGPQIRGGEAASLLRLSGAPVLAGAETYDIVLAIDWHNYERLAAEIPLRPDSLVIVDPASGDVPDIVAQSGARIADLALAELAKNIEGGRVNMVALGALAGLIGLPEDVLAGVIAELLAHKGGHAVEAGVASARAGIAAAASLGDAPKIRVCNEISQSISLRDRRGSAPSNPARGHRPLDPIKGCPMAVGLWWGQGAKPLALDMRNESEAIISLRTLSAAPEHAVGRWMISGNQAAGLGAIRGGVRFVAAYPITPATDILEWMAPALAKIGGRLVQAEDELASINMAIGASYGGVPAMTATSGPGVALMAEAIGLAAASEVPVVVVDVMRCGPSTGIATKSEQGDLNIAVYGLHGDAAHVVVAPLSPGDCLATTQWAVHLAESLQCPALVLSDQLIGQAQVVIDRPADVAFLARREIAEAQAENYRRYAVTASGVSPMALPGTPGVQYTADGLSHDERGSPSTEAADHLAQLDKRQAKLDRFDFGDLWADFEGAGSLAVVTWGSSAGAAREAVAGLDGVRLVALRLILPTRPARLEAALDGAKRILVVEQSHSGQFHRFLRAHYDLPGEVRVLNRPGPLPIGPSEIVEAIGEWS